ncbi:GDP-mannose 4,6-dehydratase [Roseiflexus sp.]|uniref:GDP-mannose 4,6-dehydratase n=1 Tax=Roseiflexus sp. TaxID=2562120 RepID=UPI00398B7BF9
MNYSEICLVTGAGGFIGSHLVETLAARGYRVRAFVRYNGRGDPGLLRDLPRDLRAQVEIVFGDLRDSHAVREAARGVDTIFHLGALIAIPYSYIHPRETVETNVLGTLNVLEAARVHSVRRLVHTSTSEVYGTARAVPIGEDHPLQGQSPYSASKIGADKLVESFHLSFGIPAVTVRPFNTYGPRQSARAVIPTIIVQALTCSVVRLGDLRPTRDLNYVSDTVAGFLAAADRDEAIGRTINLANNDEISVGELAEKIIALVGRDVRIETDEARLRPATSEVFRLHGDNRLARELLGWQPLVSLEEGLRRTIDWIAQHIDRYDPLRYQV